MSVMNIMPQAVNETVRGFEGAHMHPATPDLGVVAIKSPDPQVWEHVSADVDALYRQYDPQMNRLLGKIAGVEEPR